MQEEPAPIEPALDGNTVAEIILEAFANALVDWWYVWVLMIAAAIVLATLNNWSRRVEARRRAERRAQERAERQLRR